MNKSAILGFAAGILGLVVVGAVYFAAAGAKDQPRRPGTVVRPPANTTTPVSAVRKPTAESAKNDLPTEIRMRRAISNSAQFQPGATVEIMVSLVKQGNSPILAAGIVEHIPEGWTFDGMIKGEYPDLVPAVGKTKELEFAWFQIPPFPAAFTYRLKTTAESTAPVKISGEALYRMNGPEYRTGLIVSELTPGNAKPAPTAPPKKSATEPKASIPPEKAAGAFQFSRELVQSGYTPGEPVELGLKLNHQGPAPVTAIAIVEHLPAGWTFEEVTGGTPPAVAPKRGATGTVNFVWITPPAWPAALNYTVKSPDSETGTRQLTGSIFYRTNGPQEETDPVATDIPQAAQ